MKMEAVPPSVLQLGGWSAISRVRETQFKSHCCMNSFKPRRRVILVWTPLALCCWDVLCDGTFLGPRCTIFWGGASDSGLQYLLISLVEIQSFCSLEVSISVPAGEMYSTACTIPCSPLGGSSQCFERLCFAKKISVSCIRKAANHQDVFYHLAFPPHPQARECLAMSWGCIPAWLVAGCLCEELLALVQKVLLLLHCADIRPEEKHMYWSIM